MIIGILSDTHGTLDGHILTLFRGVDHIIHAGDIGAIEILDDLRRLAPVTAVRGNTDHYSWAKALPSVNMVTIESVTFYLLHDLYRLDLDPVSAGVNCVISGHTHTPQIQHKHNVLYLNPGSASHGRQGNPPSVAKIVVDNGRLSPEIITLR